ncbi:hypothetical protein M3182_14725 [Mesobacillus maritimus]|uniref:hypothetical protein n=1 Tax=Mesobacillus maritimus TaxID=1643336 RepID=UPI00203FEEA0|nr:hypothetical protein [Mesobacillus maritimus]MCM3586990.1 hypothetical protein [Mesobacillus maritimus]
MIITIIVVGLMAMGMIHAWNGEGQVEANYLLIVLATVGALGGVAFALYGWYSTRNFLGSLTRKWLKRLRNSIKRIKKSSIASNRHYKK